MGTRTISRAPAGPPGEHEKAAPRSTRGTARTNARGVASPVPGLAPKPPTECPEVEQGVIAAFLLRPELVGLLVHELGLSRRHFLEPAHQAIFAQLQRIFDEGAAISFFELTRRLCAEGNIEALGGTIIDQELPGPAFLVELFTVFPARPGNVEDYLDLLLEHYAARQAGKLSRWEELHGR